MNLVTTTLLVSASLLVMNATATGADTAGEFQTDTLDPAAAITAALPDEALRRLVTEALVRNPRLAVLTAEARAADQRAPQDRALPDPNISLTLYLSEPQTRVGPQKAAASISQKFPWFGKLDLEGKADMFEAAAAWTRIETARLELLMKVRDLYLELQYLDRERTIVGEDQSTLELYEQLAQARYASGVGMSQTVVKIQAEITRARTRVLGIDQRRAALIADINALRERPRNTPVPVGALQPVIGALPPFDVMRARALDARPELAEVDALIEAATVRIGVVEKENRPSFTVGLTYAWVGGREDAAGRFNPPEDNGDDILGLMGGFSLPIWGDKREAGAEEGVQRRLAAEAARRSIVAEIDGDLADLAHRIPLIREQMELFDGVLTAQADESLRSAEAAYASGSASALDLLDAERTFLQVRIGAERARMDLAIAAADLEGVLASPLIPQPVDGNGSAS